MKVTFWIVVLYLLGGRKEARKLRKVFEDVKKTNEQEECLFAFPCKKCGRWPHVDDQWQGDKDFHNFWIGCWHSDKETWDEGDDVRYVCVTSTDEDSEVRFKSKQTVYNIAASRWNERYGTIDALHLKYLRSGIKTG